jgi:glycosyltransferase involved in cell wall biosynthesis
MLALASRARAKGARGGRVAVELSVVLPVFDEVAALRGALDALRRVLEPLGRPYELICIDDGSRDGSGALLDALAAADPRLVVIHFSRNFGKEAALHAGLEAARGDAAVFLDADLQHPPELVPLMVELWAEQGFEVVEGRKRHRGDESAVYRGLAALFYRLLGSATRVDMRGASDFVLLDRAALEALKGLPERNRFFRGLVQWIGFRTTHVEFDVGPRRGGGSGWSAWRLLRYGVDGILSFTTFPLVLIALVGLVTTLLGSSLGFIALYHWATGSAVSGFTTVILMSLIFSGLILVSLGTVSLYLARLVEEVKGRPLYIARPTAKSPPDRAAPAARP